MSTSSFDNEEWPFIPWYKIGIGLGLYSCENSYSFVLETIYQIKHWGEIKHWEINRSCKSVSRPCIFFTSTWALAARPKGSKKAPRFNLTGYFFSIFKQVRGITHPVQSNGLIRYSSLQIAVSAPYTHRRADRRWAPWLEAARVQLFRPALFHRRFTSTTSRHVDTRACFCYHRFGLKCICTNPSLLPVSPLFEFCRGLSFRTEKLGHDHVIAPDRHRRVASTIAHGLR